tara:strand:+ start:8846 stop:9373 length:528 start_codon:yes stop_codon:yes gene_type:complete
MGTNTISAEAIGSVPRCDKCSSERVVVSAWACFNPASGSWEIETVRENKRCHQCDSTTTLVWSRAEEPPNHRVRELNDLFRTRGQGNGTIFVTQGVQAEGDEFIAHVVTAVRNFDAFNKDNDPWGEHDFGAVEVYGQKVFFKIDCYDPTCTQGSENPANEALTHRVLTIMLASEY